jgi:tRNA A-37 threonylcarbamoyl transferase component Bud32
MSSTSVSKVHAIKAVVAPDFAKIHAIEDARLARFKKDRKIVSAAVPLHLRLQPTKSSATTVMTRRFEFNAPEKDHCTSAATTTVPSPYLSHLLKTTKTKRPELSPVSASPTNSSHPSSAGGTSCRDNVSHKENNPMMRPISAAVRDGSSPRVLKSAPVSNVSAPGLFAKTKHGSAPLAPSTSATARKKSREELKRLVNSLTLQQREQSFSSVDFYSIGKVLGEGAYGKVLNATHIMTGQKVAVKTFEKAKLVDLVARKRVSREIRILKYLDHPNIVQLFEVIDQPQRRYIIMEFAAGGDLCKYVRDCKRLSENECHRIFCQILSGLAHCHAKGIVHRDIKLDNILLDSNKNVKIVDFGFSVPFERDQLLKKACGSPSYAAPEIVSRRQYSPTPVDVWSFGVVLYAMICGYFPFQGANSQELCRKIVKGKFDMPSWVPESCKDHIRSMLTVDPTQRITIENVALHPWVARTSVPSSPLIALYAPRLECGSGKQTVDWEGTDDSVGGIGLVGTQPDDTTLDAVVDLGFQKAFAEFCIRRGGHNSATVAYWLLASTHKRAGECKSPELLGDAQARLRECTSDGEAVFEGPKPDSPLVPADAADDDVVRQ